MLRLAASLDFEIEKMDVMTIFLHGDLIEEIYMEQPKWLRVTVKEDYVCKLKKSLVPFEASFETMVQQNVSM